MASPSEKAKAIFLAAIDLKPDQERLEYVDAQCRENESLRGEVRELLSHHAKMGSFLKDVAVGSDGVASLAAGTEVGPYKLLEQIGEGGMGVVYLAEQTTPVKRQVALKIIRPGMDSRQVLARFEAERQALALMDHPNIAKVFDAGTTDSGHPYFVMELVQGTAITEYCDRQHLAPDDRLGLFVTVCHAVQHAHQKGVIHRDLKPSNVLVSVHDGRPSVKIIDFGVAKAIDQPLTEATLFTQFGQLVGTIEYMSPEQAELKELDVDTRTDVYALGVLLYELLTGTTPFDRARLRSAAFDEMLKIIREEEPPKPSTRLGETNGTLPSISAQRQMDPKRLSLLMRGELDWVVMKAIDKDRARRYDTASSLAADLSRYLSHEPVLAHPPSTRYRIKKFASRHRVGLLTTAGFALVLVGAATVSIDLAIKARRAEVLARSERDRARHAEREAARYSDKYQREARKALTLADNEQDARRQAEANFEQAQRAVEQMFTEVSESRDLLRQMPGSQELRKKLLERAQQYYAQLIADNKSEDLNSDLALAIARLGQIQLETGSVSEAEKSLRKSLRAFEKLLIADPDSVELRYHLSQSHRNLGRLCAKIGKTAEATTHVHKAIALGEKLVSEHPSDDQHRDGLAQSYMELSRLWQRQGKGAEAERELIRAIELKRVLLERASTPERRRDFATSLSHLAALYLDRARPAEAINEYTRAIAIWNQLLAESPSTPEYQSGLASSYLGLSTALGASGDAAAALEGIQRVIALAEQVVLQNPAVPEYREVLADAYANRAAATLKEAKPDQANVAQSVEDGIRANELSQWKSPSHLSVLAAAYAQSGEFDTAIELQQKAISLATDEDRPEMQSRLKVYQEKHR